MGFWEKTVLVLSCVAMLFAGYFIYSLQKKHEEEKSLRNLAVEVVVEAGALCSRSKPGYVVRNVEVDGNTVHALCVNFDDETQRMQIWFHLDGAEESFK